MQCVTVKNRNFLKEQEASELLLHSLGIETPLHKISSLGPLLF